MGDTKPQTELDTTASIAALRQENARLLKENQLLQIERRELFFSRLFSGGYFVDRAHIAAHAAVEGICFDRPFFLVIAARLEKWGAMYSGTIQDTQEIHFMIRNALEYQFPEASVSQFQGSIAAIMNTQADYRTDILPLIDRLTEIVQLLEDEFQITVSFAVSRVYTSLTDIPQAWEDTRNVFDYLDIVAEDALVSAYQELSVYYHKSAPISYVEVNTKLNSSLRTGNLEGIRSTLHEMIDHEFSKSPTIDTLRFRTYGVVNTLLYLMNDLRAIVGNELIDQLNVGPRLTKPQPFSALITEIDSLLDDLAALSNKKVQTELPAWVTPVHDYVCEHFQETSLSVGLVSEHFHVTPTYCSKLFKERYGVRLFDFIQLKRLEAAKALLPTEKSLKDISEEVGFGCALTMTRAFKRYEGIPPMHYR